MVTVPIAATPSQVIAITLSKQACKIKIYQKATGVFCDVYVNDALVIGGVICLNKNKIVRSKYLGFLGDLAFFDMQGESDPDYTGLGTRFILLHITPEEL